MEQTTTDVTSVRAARDVVAAISRLRRRLREVSGTDALSPSQTSVIGLLSKNGPSSASALATTEGVRPQSMAATLAVLYERGLITRKADPSDGRRQVVSLTRAGERLYTGGRAVRQEWLVRAITENCTDRERCVLVEAAALMQRLTDR